MAEFGWAYVSGSNLPQGPNKSVQVKNGDEFNGNSNFTYDVSTNELILSGNMQISGTLFVNEFTTNVTNKNVINLSSTGSTQIGDTADDIHSFTGTVNVAGALSSSLNISASAFYGDGSNLSGLSSTLAEVTTNGNTTTNQISVAALTASTGGALITGSLFVSASTHPLYLSGLQAGDRLDANSYLALDSSGRIILTSSLTSTQTSQIAAAGSSDGNIGDPEDGSYTDGLFTDFASNTPVGTAVDRFNEVLKILAPSPAPSLRSARADETNGVSAKLSFDSSNAISGYTHYSAGLTYTNESNALATIFSGVSQNSTFQPATSAEITNAKTNVFGNGTHFQLGIYNNQEITGTLNYDVGPSITNGYVAFASGAFGNAETGSLVLTLNGATIHSLDLSTNVGTGNPATGSATSLNSSGSGFINLSVTASSFDGNNSEWYIFKHRTAGFKVAVADQASGSNIAIVYHQIGSTYNYVNGIVWINDPAGAAAALSVTNNRIEDVSLVGSKYVSGVKYNTDLTANYKADILNMYKNVFPSDSNTITFTPTNSTTPSAQSVPNIGGSEDNTKTLGITASVNYNGTYLLNGTIGMSLNATHPLKSNLSTAGSTTITGMLIDADTSSPNSNLSETFEDEDFRISSGSYDTQGAVSSGTWDSTAHMTSSGKAGHDDGMLIYNRRLYNPRDGDVPNNGNFSTLANVASGQPNYSGQTGIRTYFRKIQNTSGATIYSAKITSQKNGFKFNEDSVPFDSNDAHFLAKIPGKTGWMNISENFAYGSVGDGDGCYVSTATANSNRINTFNSVHVITFGTASIADDEYFLIKIETNNMAGYVSQLDFQLGASAETAATPQALSDIDANDTGTSAKLSFGSSNAISGYSNVAGSGVGSMSTINSNGDYTVSGDRRGIFSAVTTIDGEINDAIAADGGNDFPAKAFFNAYSGSLILEVNGSEVHSIDLSSTLSAINTVNGSSSRLSVSAVDFSTTSDGVPDYLKPYRTGTYEVSSGNQRAGWNYARLIHRTNSDATTNYVEWVVDASGAVDNTAVSSPVLSDFNHNDIYYQSGIKYFASRPSASFSYSGSNFYSNVYSNASDAISFGTTTNSSIANIRAVGSGLTTFDSAVSQASMPALNNNANCETTTIEVTGTVLFDNLTSISGGLGIFTDHDVSVASTLKHPFKTNKTTSTASKTSFMKYSGSIGSTTLTNNEYFNTEDYRIVSGNYDNQAAAIDAGNTWNSQTAMNNGGSHDDGMVSVNGFAISPFQIGKAGDTRNNAEGSTGLQAPAGNPNYSTLTNNTRTFYRLYRYTGASTVASFTITLYGDANLVGKSGTYAASLGANKNCFVELKVPFDPNFSGADDQSTGWADVARIFDSGNQPNNDGAGIRAGSFSGEDQSIDTNGLAVSLTLGTRRIKQNQYFIVKISAHKDWTGYLSRIQVAY
tara:strand:- start:6836 stop:11119 length:4284 start_codon:yes stop_codon:yes gene_type:complete